MLNEKRIEVINAPGTLPKTWDKNAVFFANLLSLFFGNKEQTRILQEHVGRINTYGGRLIPIIDLLFRSGRNLLILEREPAPELMTFFRDELHLTLPDTLVIPHSLYTTAAHEKHPNTPAFTQFIKNISNHPSKWIDGFVTDDALCRLAELTHKKLISTYDGSRHGNDKWMLYEFLADTGIPTFETYMAHNPTEVQKHLSTLKHNGYSSAVLKAPIGASGIGMIKVAINAPVDIPKYLFHSGHCLVQGWLDNSFNHSKTIGSPSVQMFLSKDSLCLFDITDQILSKESIHEGNVSPSLFINSDPDLHRELLDRAAQVGQWLHDREYRGTASVDFLIIEQSGRKTAYVCELNARVTGATYPSLLARHFLPRGAWQMRNVLLEPPLPPPNALDLLRRQGLLYNPGAETGMFPINFNQNHSGTIEKCQLLALAPDVPTTSTLFNKLKSSKEMTWDYDRD